MLNGKAMTSAAATDIEQTFNNVRRVNGGAVRKIK